MKKIIAVFFCLGALGVFALAGMGLPQHVTQNEKDFLRLHVRANSNSAADQDVKYLVKQQIVNELTPMFVDVKTKREAMEKLESSLPRIKKIADDILSVNGFNYTARAAIKSELFPTRAYTTEAQSVTLPEGVYDALIIELGSGAGDNWWCVVYPPLCFLENNIGGDSGVKYKSKLQEIIKRYF